MNVPSRVVAGIDELYRTVPALMIGNRKEFTERVMAAHDMIAHAFRVNGVEVQVDDQGGK